MSAIDDIRKVLQDFLAPELRTINARLDNINDRINNLEGKMDLRFDAIRLERLERITEERKPS